MKGSYSKLHPIREAVQEWQENDYGHPLTCGNDSRNHKILRTSLTLLATKTDEFELLLVCDDCFWKQDIPRFIIEKHTELCT